MAMDAMQLGDNVLRVVTVRELKQHHKPGPSTSTPTSFMPSSVRFGAKKKRGGKV